MPLLEEMTWTEIEALRGKTDTVLVPIGSIEVEGPHLPLGVDSIVSRHVAEKVAEGCNAVIGPLISITYSGWHNMFPGTLNIRPETLMDVIRQFCGTMMDIGLQRVVFINGHVGNDFPIMAVGTEIRETRGGLVSMVGLWQQASEFAASGGEQLGLKECRFLHAGEVMTSVMLHIRPDLVKMSRAAKEYVKSKTESISQVGSFNAKFRGHSFSIYYLSGEVTGSGVMGDPTNATPEKGKAIVDNWVETIRGFVQEFQKVPLELARCGK